jgi:cytochrome c biogenesis protein CcdA/glutaredoxin
MKKIINYVFIFICLLVFPIFVSAKEDEDVTLYLFHGDGCPHCAAEIKFLESIEDKYDYLKIVKYEVWYNDDNATLLNNVKEALDVSTTGVPVTVIGDTVITGYTDSIGNKISRAIEYYHENDYKDVVSEVINGTYVKKDNTVSEEEENSFSKQESESDEDATLDVPIVGKINFKNVSLMTSAVIIGLIDGFNPCAMWVLLFLISVLIGMKDRKRMWAIGLTFLITSGLVYLLIMLSWISIVVKVTTIVWVRNVIAVIAVIGGLVNLRSFLKSNDSGCNVVDDKKRKSIFKKIKKFTSEKSFILALLGAMGLAISINLVELACSAGLPLVFSELLALNNTSEFMKVMYTLVYVFFFLIDDLVVFFIAMFTMKVTGISTKYNKYSHLIGGLIMLVVGILLIFKPGLLMFNFN